MRMKKLKEKNKKRKLIIILEIEIITLFLLIGSYAWYIYSGEKKAKQNIEIMTPYFLYLMNAGDKKSLEFAVGNLHPGETKKVIICVTNERPENELDDNTVDIARESQFYYDLEFIHTDNLGVQYDIYELEREVFDKNTAVPEDSIMMDGIDDYYWTAKGTKLDMTDVSKQRHQEVFQTTEVSDIWNAGQYLIYRGDSGDRTLQLEYLYDEEKQSWEYEYDYYMIEINWKQDIKFSDYSKETDMVYVVVNAKQVMPTVD